MPLASARLLVALLLHEQHRVEPAGVPLRYPSPPPAERHLIGAATALAAGRAKGALRELRQSEHDPTDPDHMAAHEALYLAALALDLNWSPDDVGVVRAWATRTFAPPPAGLAKPAGPSRTMTDAPLIAWTTQVISRQRHALLEPTTAVICVLGAAIIPGIRVARAQLALTGLRVDHRETGRRHEPGPHHIPHHIPHHMSYRLPHHVVVHGHGADPPRAARTADPAGTLVMQALATADLFVTHLDELPVPQAAAYARILRADLLFRANQEAEAGMALDAVEAGAGSDHATLAHAALVRGDWAGFPDGGAQTLGRRPGGSRVIRSRTAYPERAEELWQRALTAYGRAGSEGGRAAGLLRLAGAPTAAGRPILRRARIDEAARRARTAGNEALTWLARVQSQAEQAVAGEPSAAGLRAMMTALADWSRLEGSTSYGRGLGRLLIDAGTAGDPDTGTAGDSDDVEAADREDPGRRPVRIAARGRVAESTAGNRGRSGTGRSA
ncbi:hypothetical protein [Frankia sp. B2]|uniref:hypothetical protein n=1 Tax=Frankia sp. B2 TaxID=2541730 RepID=UPI001F100096|nr:hypothetical protein [Frankia sp. B2]